MEAWLSSLDPLVVIAVVAILAFGESAAFASLVLPGEVALLAGGGMAAALGFSPVGLAAGAVTGAFLGAMVGYWMGQRFGNRLVAWPPVARRLGRWMPAVSERLRTRGTITVVLSRFNQVTRALIPLLAGMAPMPAGRFIVINLTGAIAWVATFVSVGYLGVEWFANVDGVLETVGLVALAVLVAGWFVLGRRRTQAS